MQLVMNQRPRSAELTSPSTVVHRETTMLEHWTKVRDRLIHLLDLIDCQE
jgi:hypothetical protein